LIETVEHTKVYENFYPESLTLFLNKAGILACVFRFVFPVIPVTFLNLNRFAKQNLAYSCGNSSGV